MCENDDLRTDLTKYASTGANAFVIRALLAAHPAEVVSDTRREDGHLGAKYRVERLSDPSGKHTMCGYFVLDPQHDPHAVTAMRAYSVAVRTENPALADGLDVWVGAPPASDTRREDVEALRGRHDATGLLRPPYWTSHIRDALEGEPS